MGRRFVLLCLGLGKWKVFNVDCGKRKEQISLLEGFCYGEKFLCFAFFLGGDSITFRGKCTHFTLGTMSFRGEGEFCMWRKNYAWVHTFAASLKPSTSLASSSVTNLNYISELFSLHQPQLQPCSRAILAFFFHRKDYFLQLRSAACTRYPSSSKSSSKQSIKLVECRRRKKKKGGKKCKLFFYIIKHFFLILRGSRLL